MLRLFFVSLIVACTADPTPTDPNRGQATDGKADGQSGSCHAATQSFCGGQSAGSCYCDDSCADFHDCCVDAAPVCGVESNRLEDQRV